MSLKAEQHSQSTADMECLMTMATRVVRTRRDHSVITDLVLKGSGFPGANQIANQPRDTAWHRPSQTRIIASEVPN
jgi:hypothetical protein